jgi:hypothetical protein
VLENLPRVYLSEHVVVGSYYRWEHESRDNLKALVRRIEEPLRIKTNQHENFILWAKSGSGKTFLIEQLVADISKSFNIQFVKCVLSTVTTEGDLASQLRIVSESNGPVLCLVDEVDAHGGKTWPYNVLFTMLDLQEKMVNPVVFVLIGSTGDDLNSMIAYMTKAKDSKGQDLVNRVPVNNRFSIPPFTLGDNLVMIVGHQALQNVSSIEKAALAYILQDKKLISAAHTLNDFLKAAASRLELLESRLCLHHLFDFSQDAKTYNSFVEINKTTLVALDGNVEIKR